MRDLAARLGLAESTVTRLVDRLETAGLVRRRASEPDRRVVLAELTPQGRRLALGVEASRRDFLAEMLAGLEPAERRELVRLFAKMTRALSGQAGGAGAEERP